jgi:tetratricopeptide (TPR) repeat protein
MRQSSTIGARGRGGPWSAFAVAAGLALLIFSLVASGCGDGRLGQAKIKEQARDLAGANRLYEQVLRDDPQDLAALRGLAINLTLLGKFAQALPYQEKVVKADPKDAQTRVELGFNYLNHQERAQDGLRLLEEAAALDGSARNRTFVAQARLAAGDAIRGERDLKAVIKDDPSYPFAYRLLAGLLEKQGRGAEAADVKRSADEHGISVNDSTT